MRDSLSLIAFFSSLCNFYITAYIKNKVLACHFLIRIVPHFWTLAVTCVAMLLVFVDVLTSYDESFIDLQSSLQRILLL